MVFNAVFNGVSVILQRSVHLSMLSYSSFKQCSAQYFCQATGCFSTLLCIYPVLPSSVHVCIYFEWFPLWLFLELDFLLWNIVLEVSGPFYNLITRNYATDFNMNFLEVSLLL